MNKISSALFIICSMLFSKSDAQVITVLDKATLEPVIFAAIASKSGSSVVTNEKGRVDIQSLGANDSLVVFHTSYGKKTIAVKDIISSGHRVLLSSRVVNMGEVILSANRYEEKKSDIPYQVDVISPRKVELMNPQTTADMLQNSAGVMVQKSQMGGGSPVIRGFEANKVLIVVDGVRMNNAIYRGGHLQDVITIDNSMLKRTEVVYGPSSVIYGSDALGGVMHFYTKDPVFSDTIRRLYTSANAMMRFSSANNENTGHFDFNAGLKKIAFLTSITHSDFDDLRNGYSHEMFPGFGQTHYYVRRINGKDSVIKNNDLRLQRYSGYSQFDLLEKIIIDAGKTVKQKFTLNYSSTSNIPRFDRLQQSKNGKLRYAEWSYGPQKRLLAISTTEIDAKNKFFRHLKLTLAMQDVHQERITRELSDSLRKTQKENVKMYSVNADFEKKHSDRNETHYGVEGTWNNVNSKAEWNNINSDSTFKADTRYPDGGSAMGSAAAYVYHSWKPNEALVVDAGLRYSYITLSASFLDLGYFPFPFTSTSQDNSSLNGNLGFVFKPTESTRYTALFSTGFRAPNVDDLGKVFDSSPGVLIVPNPGLKAEHAINGETGFSHTFRDKIRLEAAYFYTLLKNAIVIKNFQLNGADSVIYAGVMSKVKASQNTDEAIVQGVSATLSGEIVENISFKASFNYTQGIYRDVVKDTAYPLDHIPPVFGQLSLSHFMDRVENEIYVQYNGAKRLKDYSPSGEDNLQTATPEGMPAWITLNVKTGIRLNRTVRINVGVENILDTHYRVFASGISAPGRNFVVALRAKL